MPVRTHLLRLLHLVQKLQAGRGRALPFAELQRSLLEHSSLPDKTEGYDQRTLQRDLLEIRDLFGVTVKHQRGYGYYIAEADPLLPGHTRLLEAVALQEFLQLPAALRPYVQPETRRAQGLEHLGALLRAAQGRRVVEFAYRKHWEDAAGTRTVGPLLLKEFRGRWYVLGQMAWGEPHLACFGLDRLSDLRETGDTFVPPVGFDPAAYYADAFGITRPQQEEPQQVTLQLTAPQGRYVLGYPLHHSQRVLANDGHTIRLSLRVYLTHELYMELLSYGDSVEVLAPASLRDWLREGHRAAGG